MRRDHRKYGVNALSALLLLFACPAVGRAEENPIERARHCMERGQESFHQGHYEAAARHFVEAHEASAFSAFLYNAGLAYDKAGDATNAVEWYRRYLAADPQAADAAKVVAKIEQLEKEVAPRPMAGSATPPKEPTPEAPPPVEVEMKSLISVRTNPANAEIRILDETGTEVSRAAAPLAQTVDKGRYKIQASHPDFRTVETEVSVAPGQVYVVVVEMSQGVFLGFLRVTTDVPGAALYVDDKNAGQVGVTPFSNVLPPGKHAVWLEKPGYAPIETVVDVDLGEKLDAHYKMERLSFGTLLIKTNADADILVDGSQVGSVRAKRELVQPLAPGKHRMRVVAEGMKPYATSVEIEPGRQTKVVVKLNHKPSRSSAWASASFSAALFAGGGAFGGIALSKRKSLIADRDDGRLASDDPRSMQSFLWGIGADVSFGVGALIGALSIHYFLRDPIPPSDGKRLKPVDFEENPADVKALNDSFKRSTKGAATPRQALSQPAVRTSKIERRIPRPWMIAPILSADVAGLGLGISF